MSSGGDSGLHKADDTKQEVALQNDESPKQKWPSAITILLITAFIFISSQLLVGFIIVLWALLFGVDTASVLRQLENSNEFIALITLLVGAIQFALIMGVVRLHGLHPKDIGITRFMPKDVSNGLLLWAGYFVLSTLALLFLQFYDLGIDLEQQQQIGFSQPNSLLGLVIIYLAIVVTPALIEEVLMRGYLFKGLRQKFAFWPTTLVVSALFGVLHLEFFSDSPLLWIAFVDTFILSLFLCWGVEKYASVWPAVIAHGIKNSIAFLALFVFA